MSQITNLANVASEESVHPTVAVRLPYSTPLLTRFGLVRDWTQKSGQRTDNATHPTKA